MKGHIVQDRVMLTATPVRVVDGVRRLTEILLPPTAG